METTETTDTTAVSTINVIEYANDTVLGVRSFTDNESGNKEAEEVYRSIIKEHDPDSTIHEVEMFLEDGYYEQGDYQVFLAHSA